MPPETASVAEYATPTVPFGREPVIAGAAAIVTGYDLDALAPFESVTVALTVYEPLVLGVPLICPDVLNVRPGGTPVAFHVTGDAPPEAARLAEYNAPTVPLGREGVVIERAGEIVMVYDCDAVAPFASRTVTTMVGVPAVAGVPPSTPAVLRVRPAGTPVAVHVRGAAPPPAAKLAEYDAPAVPLGREVVVIERAGEIVPLNEFDALTEFASVTVASMV
jgi:hypothetical protein